MTHTTDNPLKPTKLRRARHRSKRDDHGNPWPTVSGQLDPATYERFEALTQIENKWSTDLVREAIELLLKEKAA